MSTIAVSCIDQTLAITNAPLIASGGIGENDITFTFDSLWSGYAKTCVFWTDPNTPYTVVLDANNSAVIPSEVLSHEGRVFFGVFGISGSVRRTSEVLSYEIAQGVLTSGTTPAPPTPGVYEQLLTAYGEAMQAVEDLEDDVEANTTAIATINASLTNTFKIVSYNNLISDEIPAGSSLQGNTSLSQAGYVPVGIIGHRLELTGLNPPPVCLNAMYVNYTTDSLWYEVKNVSDSVAAHIRLDADVLFTKLPTI